MLLSKYICAILILFTPSVITKAKAIAIPKSDKLDVIIDPDITEDFVIKGYKSGKRLKSGKRIKSESF
jgi:hypothetical protein